MPQLRSGKVVRADEVKPADSEVSSPGSSEAECESRQKLVVKLSPRLALKRKCEQPLRSFPQLNRLSGASFKCFALPVPMQKEQSENRQKFPGKKAKGIQPRKFPRRKKGVASPASHPAECEDWQAAATAAAVCWEETLRGTGQSQQLFFSGTALQKNFSTGIERNEHCSEELNYSGSHKGSRSSGKEGKHSCMEIKLQVPSLEEEIESTERDGISCFPEPEGLQPEKITWSTEVKCTDSIMTQNMQIPDFSKNLGALEAMPEPKPQEEIDIPGKLNVCPLVGSTTLGTKEKEGRSVVKPKVHGPRERGSSALLEQHTQCAESRKGALSMRNRNALLLQKLRDLSGQEQPTTKRRTLKRCMKEEQQSSSPQKGPGSPGESAEEQLKAVKQDTGTSQAVKKIKTKQNRAEDSKEKESHYSRTYTVSTSGDTDSESFLCRAVTEEPGVQCRKRQRRSGQIKHLQSLSVAAAEEVMSTSAEYDAEHCSNALHHCSGLLCATKKNPFVILEDCSYINTLVKPSASGTTNSYKLNGFFRVAHGSGVLSDGICSTSRMQNERSLIKSGISSNKEKNENEEGCVSCCLSESSKCLRGKKRNISRKRRKKMNITEKCADVAGKCKKCELQTEAAVAMSSSFAVSGLNHTLSASCDHTSDFDKEKNTHELQTVSAWRKKRTKLLASETGFKKTSELSVKGENSSSAAHYAAVSDSLRVFAQIRDVSDRHKSKTGGNLNKINKKCQQFTCQRTIPMTGKKVWPVESCARTSEWFLKDCRSTSEGKRLLKAAFENSSDKSSLRAVGHSTVTGNVRQLDLHTSLGEITKEITHKKIDPNTDFQTSLEATESSSVDIYETLTMNNEDGESPVNKDRSAVTFSHDDVEEVKATLNFTAKQKDEDEGDVTERNLSVTVQNGTIKQKDKNEGELTSRNLSVTVQNGTIKQKHKDEGVVTNRNLSVIVQNGKIKQKDKNEGVVKNRKLSVTIQNGTIKEDKEEGVVKNRNLSVMVQNGTIKEDKEKGVVKNKNLSVTIQNDTTKRKDRNEGEVTIRNLSGTVQNGSTKLKDKNGGEVTIRNLSGTVQNGTSTSNSNSINFSPKVSEVNQTLSDLNPIKPLTSRNMRKFKIPLCRNKPESKKLGSVHSFESKTCSPLELPESSSRERQKTGEESFLVKSEQRPLPVMSDAASPVSRQKKADEMDSKDFQQNGSVNLSDEMSVLPESFSAYPHPLLDGQPEPSVPDFYGTECVLKSSFPDHSWNAVNHLGGLEINGDRKSRRNFSQHKSQNLPDVLEAYNQDVLVIDVIQDDPDLFGTSNEEELSPACCENCPVRASSANCIEDTKLYIKPESPTISEKTYSVESSLRCLQESAMSGDTENSCNLVFKVEDVKTHNSSRGSSPTGDVSEESLKDRKQSKLDELLTSLDVDEKFKLADGVPDVEENKSEVEKSDYKYKVSCELLSGLPLNDQNSDLFSEATQTKSWTNGYKSSERSTLLSLKNCGDLEPWKMEKNAITSHSVQHILDTLNLPRKYCRCYFMTSRGCERTKCWFCHVPGQGDEKVNKRLFQTLAKVFKGRVDSDNIYPVMEKRVKEMILLDSSPSVKGQETICMTILRTYISTKESGLLKRAVQIFVQYYKEVTPGVDFAPEVLNDLLVSLLNNCLLQEVFQILNLTVKIKTLPAVDILLKVFEHVASLNIRNAVPTLINIFCKLIGAGMFLELEHFDYIVKLLHQLQVSSWEMTTVLNIKSRFKERYFEKTWSFDFNLAVAEIQHCKEKRDWTKLGALYLNARTGCEHFDDLQKLFVSIAEILAEDSERDRSGVPFCDFADAVMKNSYHNKADRVFIGRTGISVMYSYHKVLQWVKGSKVLDKLHELQIHFTRLKGLVGAGRSASRCQIVNKAAEIFLHSGNLDGATRVLRESEWITDTPLWPCDKMDILNRHNLLCAIVHKYLRKNLHRQAFEVLQNSPDLQKHSDIVNASQYSCLFNKLINACFESKNLGVSSSAVDFMLSKKIAVDFVLLRRLITALGRNSLWSKARAYYKNALSLGCYPELQGTSCQKVLKIPSYLSEVEMLLTIEIFLVSNASAIQSPRTTSQTVRILLKRSEDTVQNNSAYREAVERLIQATCLSGPKLFLKHMTMNVNKEEVYTLEHSSALKWLQENKKWAEKVWLFQ